MAARFRKAVGVVQMADDAFIKLFKNKRQQLKAARERAADETGIELRRLQIAQQQGLKLPRGEEEEEEEEDLDDIARDKQAKIIRGMVITYDQKRNLRFDLNRILFVIVCVVVVIIIVIIIIVTIIIM